MKDIQAKVIETNKNILEIVNTTLEKVRKERYDDIKQNIITAANYNLKVEMARVEGYITGKISAAQKEPESIKL